MSRWRLWIPLLLLPPAFCVAALAWPHEEFIFLATCLLFASSLLVLAIQVAERPVVEQLGRLFMTSAFIFWYSFPAFLRLWLGPPGDDLTFKVQDSTAATALCECCLFLATGLLAWEASVSRSPLLKRPFALPPNQWSRALCRCLPGAPHRGRAVAHGGRRQRAGRRDPAIQNRRESRGRAQRT